MFLAKIKTTNKDNFLNPLPDEVEKFKEIFEDFERKIYNQRLTEYVARKENFYWE